MNTIRGLIVASLLTAGSLLPQAWATSFSTDQDDVWAVTGENGWGFQLAERDSVMFATMYVHDPTSVPIWYTATLEYAGNLVWMGELYLTYGPWFGTVPLNSSAVTYRKVGAMTWTATSVTTGKLRYDVDGAAVVKNATRLSLRFDDFSGHFGGGIRQTRSGCADPGFNGPIEDIGALNIIQNGQSISMTSLRTTGRNCLYDGTLTQAGQMSGVTGSFVCTSGETGAFQLYEMQVDPIGVTGRLTTNSIVPTGCQADGWFGGIRVTNF